MNVDQTLAERGARYGAFTDHAALSQELKTALYARIGKRGMQLAPDQCEALEMIAHKLARIANGDPNYADNWRDIAGYATLVMQRLEAQGG